MQPCQFFMHLSALTSSLHSTGRVKLSHYKFLRKTQKEHLSIQFFSRIVSEDQPDQTKSEEFTCSLYGMNGISEGCQRG